MTQCSARPFERSWDGEVKCRSLGVELLQTAGLAGIVLATGTAGVVPTTSLHVTMGRNKPGESKGRILANKRIEPLVMASVAVPTRATRVTVRAANLTVRHWPARVGCHSLASKASSAARSSW